jgi:NTE family protein
MISVLEDQGLIPERIHGSSGGALVGAMWAAGLTAVELRQALFDLSRRDFWDPGMGLGLLKGQLFRLMVERTAPVRRLEECNIPVSVSTFHLRTRKTRVFSKGSLAACLYASCAVPLLFQPIRIEGHLYLDGGIGDQPGWAGVPEDARTLHLYVPERRLWPIRGYRPIRLGRRSNTCSVILEGLTPVGPYSLKRGVSAYQEARQAMQAALYSRIAFGNIRRRVSKGTGSNGQEFRTRLFKRRTADRPRL